MSNPTGEDVVVKRNHLVNASYSLSLNEQRLLLGCISQIDSMSALDGKTMFHLRMTDLIDLFSITKNNRFYQQMKSASRKLYNRNIIIIEDGKRTDVRWITKKVECDGSGVLSLRFNQEVIPYLSEITGAFTKYKLKWVSKFKCSYSIRLYELMAQWKGKGTREIEVDDLREMLSIGNKYPRWAEFRRNVIDKSVDEITQHSNLDVSYGLRRSGRSVVAIQFSFRTKTSGSEKRISGSETAKGKGWKARSRKDMEKHARPGESWDELYKRLGDTKKE